MENEKIYHNLMNLKKIKNWSISNIAEELFELLHDDETYRLNANEEATEKEKFKERFSKGLKRLKNSQTREPIINLYKNGNTKFSWKECWDKLSEKHSISTKSFSPTSYKENDRSEIEEILGREDDVKIFNAHVAWLGNSLVRAREVWEYFDNEINELKKLERIAEQERLPFLHTFLGHFYFHKKEDYKKARDHYKISVNSGDELAAFQLGRMYEVGFEEIEKNIGTAIRYYKKSAEKNFPMALNKLAYAYYSGEEIKQDYSKFFEYSKRSANYEGYVIEKNIEIPNQIGKLYLAYCYEHGIGTNKNIEEAINIYEKIINEPISSWTHGVLVKLAIYFKHNGNEEKSNDYYNRSKKLILDSFDNAWKENNFEIIKIFSFFGDGLSPSQLNDIENSQYYDDIMLPDKPTVLKNIFKHIF